MKTLSQFKIAENQTKFDVVELLYDEINGYYCVRWKWTTMKEPKQYEYKEKEDAKRFYKNKRNFAILCNTDNFE